MRALILLSSVLCLLSSVTLAAPDAQLTAIIEENRGTSSKLITYADQKAAALVAAQAEIAALKQQLAAAQAETAQLRSQLSAVSAQLAAAQAATAAAIAERDAARKAVADAKATLQAAAAKL
jgi:septal ring factor EnvC (AmiA/AmiB activator)